MLGPADVGIERAQAGDENRHLGRGQRQQLRTIEQCFLCWPLLVLALVVAEAVGCRFQHCERRRIGHGLRCVRPARRERHRHGVTRLLCRRLDASTAAEHDQVGERYLLSAGCRLVEVGLDRLDLGQNLRQLRRLVDGPVLLRAEPNASTVRTAALVGIAERRRRGPGRRDQLADRQPRGEQLGLERGNVLRIDQLVIDGGDRILPDQLLLRHLGTEVAYARAHVAVEQLEPRARERVGELIRVLVVVPRDRLVDLVEAQRQIRRGHHRRVLFRGVVRIGNHVLRLAVLRVPLVRATRSLHALPVVTEHHVEVAVVPRRRVRFPRAFDAARDRVHAFAAAEGVAPAKAHLLDAAGLGLAADVLARIGRTMRLAERVTASDQGDGFLVVHRHARERLADVATRCDRIGFAVRTFRVDIDEAHLDCAERILELAVAGVALVAEPGGLATPIDVLRGLPGVRAPAAEAERLAAHRLDGDVAGKQHQVGPGDLVAVLLFDRPQQPSRLVEADVVGPAVERRKALSARGAATAAVGDAIAARAVPGHPDHEAAVVTPVGGPPILRVRHQRKEILLERRIVELLERRGVVEPLAHGIGECRVLVQNPEVQLVRPPVLVRLRGSGGLCTTRERALRVVGHGCYPFLRLRLTSTGNVVSHANSTCGLHMPPYDFVAIAFQY